MRVDSRERAVGRVKMRSIPIGGQIIKAVSACIVAAGLLIAAGLALACTDPQDPTTFRPLFPSSRPRLPRSLPPTPFVVSNPRPGLAGLASGANRSPLTSPNLDSTVVYISLPPGTIPGPSAVSIHTRGSDSSTTVALVNGGFDPVAVQAEVGDTLEFEVQAAGVGHLVYAIIVLPKSRPRVVRTNPPNHKRDVALNAVIHVVFSEPIDEATLTGASVRLRNGAAVIGGQLQFSDSAHTSADLVPEAPLAKTTDYELDITQGIQDLDGDALVAAVTVEFTTADPAQPLPTGPFLVSRPIRYVSNDWTFVSAPTGSIPTNTWVGITDARSGGSAGAITHAGGFDPLPLTAAVGDTIVITVTPGGGGDPQSYGAVVPASSVPQLVRSDPSPHTQEVWLNSHVTVVLSEPIDPGLGFDGSPAAAHLQLGSTVVDGAWWYSQSAGFDGFEVAFVPTAVLSSGADYELVLPATITGAEGGEPLAAPILIPFTTETPPAGPSDARLTAEAFGVIEFQFPSLPNKYYYAPQLRLAETGGLSGASVVQMLFTLPGLGSPLSICSKGTPVPAGQSAAMNGVRYGEYEVQYYTSDRIAPGQSTATIIFRDDAGRTDTITAQGPITSGGPPTVYYDNAHEGYNGTSPTCPPIFSAVGSQAPSSPSAPHYLKQPHDAARPRRLSW